MRHAADHGDVLGGDGRRLTALGDLQARTAGPLLEGRNISVIRSSTLTRARETTEIVAGYLGVHVVFEPRLNEAAPACVGSRQIPPRTAKALGHLRTWQSFVASVSGLMDETICSPNASENELWIAHSGTIDAVFEVIVGDHGGRTVELVSDHASLSHWEYRRSCLEGEWLMHCHNVAARGAQS